MLSLSRRVIAIYGPPGVGKTTAAVEVARLTGGTYISSGDIARAVDPEAIARGELADRAALRLEFKRQMQEALSWNRPIVVDGLPRDPGDSETMGSLLPRENTFYVLLDCWPEVAIDRQLMRSREGDTMGIIRKRSAEQREIMELDRPDGWAVRLADAIISTGSRTRGQVLEQVKSAVSDGASSQTPVRLVG